MGRTVLWAPHKGDVIYSSKDWRRRNIPIGDMTIVLAHADYFDVGAIFELAGGEGKTYVVTGNEGLDLGLRSRTKPQPTR